MRGCSTRTACALAAALWLGTGATHAQQAPAAASYREALAPALAAVVRIVFALRAPSSPHVAAQAQGWNGAGGRRQPRSADNDDIEEPDSSGSGVVINAAKGLVLTNHHVVEDGAGLTVQLPDGRELPGRVVGSDAATDLALVAVAPGGLSEIRTDAERPPQVGDLVFSIGYPFGMAQSVTMGVVGGIGRGRTGSSFEDFIQTDARMNPGSSGGALVDSRGMLIGINAAAYLDESSDETGMNYAIPLRLIVPVIKQLEAFGEVRRSAIGADIKSVTPGLAAALGLAVRNGVLVTAIHPELAAEAAGLRVGDVVTSAGGKAMPRAADLRNLVGISGTSGTLALTVQRGREALSLSLPLDEDGASAATRLFGATFALRPGTGHRRAGQVVVLDAGAATDDAPPFVVGDVVTHLNLKPVSNLAALQRMAAGAGPDVVLSVRRGDRAILVPLRTH